MEVRELHHLRDRLCLGIAPSQGESARRRQSGLQPLPRTTTLSVARCRRRRTGGVYPSVLVRQDEFDEA